MSLSTASSLKKVKPISTPFLKREGEEDSRSCLGRLKSQKSATMPPNAKTCVQPIPVIKRRPHRPVTNEAKAKRIVKLTLDTASLCGWNSDTDTRQLIVQEMLDFEMRTYEMDTQLEHARTRLQRKQLLDGHREWVASRIKNFPRKLVIESLFYFGEEAKFKKNPQHTLSQENIERISVARSNDIRALFELLKNDVGFEIPMELVAYVDRLLVVFDLHEDLLDYADDVEHQTYNTWCAMQRLHGKDSKDAATEFLKSKLEQLLVAEQAARSSNVASSEAIDRLRSVLLDGCPVRHVELRGLELFASGTFSARCVE